MTTLTAYYPISDIVHSLFSLPHAQSEVAVRARAVTRIDLTP